MEVSPISLVSDLIKEFSILKFLLISSNLALNCEILLYGSILLIYSEKALIIFQSSLAFPGGGTEA